jgi:hypothetical protein
MRLSSMFTEEKNNTNIRVEFREKLQNAATLLIDAIHLYSKNRKLSSDRKKNIAYLLGILNQAKNNPVISKYLTPDSLVIAVYNYVTGPEFITGFFNRSELRKVIFDSVNKDYPLAFIKATQQTEHYHKLVVGLGKMINDLERAMVRLVTYKNAILTSKATFENINKGMLELEKHNIDLSSPKSILYEALVLQVTQIEELEERKKEEEAYISELDRTLGIKSGKIKTLELGLNRAKERILKLQEELSMERVRITS